MSQKSASMFNKQKHFSECLSFKSTSQLYIFFRQNFTLPNRIKISHISDWLKLIEKLPITIFQLLDSQFLWQLYEYLSSQRNQARRLLMTTQAKSLFEMLYRKKQNFQQIIEFLISQLKAKIQLNKYLKGGIIEKYDKLKQKIIKQTYDYFFHWSGKILNIYQKMIKDKMITPYQKKANPSKMLVDTFLEKYIKQQIFREQQIQVHQQKPKCIDQIILKQQLFYPESTYKDFVQKLAVHLQNAKHQIKEITPNAPYWSSPIEKIIQQEQIHRQNLLAHLQIQDVICNRCLNCVQFFYKGFKVLSGLNNTVDYQTFSSIKNIKKESTSISSILQTISAFLNSESGGTILFDCKQKVFGFQPIGQIMNLKQQEGYKLSFQNLLKLVHPQNQKKNFVYEIDFVPLKKNPLRSKGNLIQGAYKNSLIQRQFQSDCSVMRVKIRSKSKMKLFACEMDKNYYFYYTREYHGNKKINERIFYAQLKKLVYSHIKINDLSCIQKLQKHFGSENVKKIIRGRRSKLANAHPGQCKEPLMISMIEIRRN